MLLRLSPVSPLRLPSNPLQQYFMKFQSGNRCLPKSDVQSWSDKDFSSVFELFLLSRSSGRHSLLARWWWRGGWWWRRGMLALHGGFVSVFIWYLAETRSQDERESAKKEEKKKREWKARWLCLFHVGLNIQRVFKKKSWNKDKKKARKKGEIKDRHARTVCGMSKQKCLNDLLGERECRV